MKKRALLKKVESFSQHFQPSRQLAILPILKSVEKLRCNFAKQSLLYKEKNYYLSSTLLHIWFYPACKRVLMLVETVETLNAFAGNCHD